MAAAAAATAATAAAAEAAGVIGSFEQKRIMMHDGLRGLARSLS